MLGAPNPFGVIMVGGNLIVTEYAYLVSLQICRLTLMEVQPVGKLIGGMGMIEKPNVKLVTAKVVEWMGVTYPPIPSNMTHIAVDHDFELWAFNYKPVWGKYDTILGSEHWTWCQNTSFTSLDPVTGKVPEAVYICSGIELPEGVHPKDTVMEI